MSVYEQAQTLFLQQFSHNGKTQVVECTMSILGPEHAEQSIELHDRIARGLSYDIFIPSEADDIRRYLTKEGFTIGIWHDGKLVCARTVKTDGDWVNKGLEEMGEPADPTHSTALAGYMIVDKEFRGNNTQFLTYFISEALISINKSRVVSTIAPMNVFSLQNVLRCCFHVTGLKPLYGGYWRYVTEKQLREAQPIWTNWHNTVGIRNIAEQRRILAAGNVGYKLIRKRGCFAMLYAPMCLERPTDAGVHRHKPPISMF